MAGEWWTEKDVEGSGRGLILRHNPGICVELLNKPRKTSISIAGLLPEIWTRDLTNTKQER
jgi:hypothetical protein